jgi:hypothetical protein
VATGVRNAAAAETATAVNNGLGETSSSPPAETAIGITIGAVAMFEISWPSTNTSTTSPEQKRPWPGVTGIVEALVEGAPASPKQEGVADCQLRLAGQLLTLALNPEHDQISALCHHPRVSGLADQRRARRDHDLGRPERPCEQRIVLVEPVLVHERPRVTRQVDRHRPRRPVRKQALAEEDDDRDGASAPRFDGRGQLLIYHFMFGPSCQAGGARGVEFVIGCYGILDRAPKRRDEGDAFQTGSAHTTSTKG